jgi:hypothetical protein
MSGTRVEGSAARACDRREQLLRERDERIVEFMREGRPIRAIKELEGLDHDNCRKICLSLSRQYGVEYDADDRKEPGQILPEGITEQSQGFRSRLADMLYQLGHDRRMHKIEIAQATGITQRSQKYATERPFTHNWSLSQIERLAAVRGTGFRDLMLRAIFTPEEYKKVIACLNR